VELVRPLPRDHPDPGQAVRGRGGGGGGVSRSNRRAHRLGPLDHPGGGRGAGGDRGRGAAGAPAPARLPGEPLARDPVEHGHPAGRPTLRAGGPGLQGGNRADAPGRAGGQGGAHPLQPPRAAEDAGRQRGGRRDHGPVRSQSARRSGVDQVRVGRHSHGERHGAPGRLRALGEPGEETAEAGAGTRGFDPPHPGGYPQVRGPSRRGLRPGERDGRSPGRGLGPGAQRRAGSPGQRLGGGGVPGDRAGARGADRRGQAEAAAAHHPPAQRVRMLRVLRVPGADPAAADAPGRGVYRYDRFPAPGVRRPAGVARDDPDVGRLRRPGGGSGYPRCRAAA